MGYKMAQPTTARRLTLKRGELFTVGELIKARIDRSGPLVCYRGDSSDAEIADIASKSLKLPLDVKQIANVRKQLFGKLANEGRTTPEMLDGLLRQNGALLQSIKALTARVESLEKLWDEPSKESQPQPQPQPQQMRNGAHRP